MPISVGLLGSTAGFGSTFTAKAAAVGTVVVITVGGSAVEAQNETLEIQRVFCGHDTATGDVVSVDASFQPTLDSDVSIFIDGVQEFGGLLQKHTKRGVGDRGWEKLDYGLECVGYSALAERRMFTGALAAGTLKSQVDTLGAYLSAYGVVVDPAMPDGPAMPESDFENATIWSALTSLMSVTAGLNPSEPWFPRMTYGKVLSMVEVGSEAAPFSVTLGGEEAIHDVVVETTREHHANKIIGVFGPQALVYITDTLTGDGVTTSFPLSFDPSLTQGYVSNGTVNQTLGDGATWEYTATALTTTVAPTAGTTIELNYGTQMPFTLTLEDLADQALYGVIERAYEEPGIVKMTTAEHYMAAKLAAGVSPSETVTYTTLEPIVETGSTQTITLADRQLDDDYLITQIRLYAQANVVMRQITAVAGMQFHGTFRELFKNWSTGTKKPALSGGGFSGGTSIGPNTYTDFAGGQGDDAGNDCCESVDFTINDAEFKALPSVFKELVPAPGAGKVLVLTSGALYMDNDSGAYGNNDADQGLVIAYGADWQTDASLNYSPIDRRLHLWSGGGTMESAVDYLVSTFGSSYNRSSVVNQPLYLVGWNDSGNYSGGNALNAGNGRICYMVLDAPEVELAPSQCVTTAWSDDFESGSALSTDYDGNLDVAKTASVGYGGSAGLQGTGDAAHQYYGYVSKIVAKDSRSGCVTCKVKPNVAIDQFGFQIIRISATTDTSFAPAAMIELVSHTDGITAGGKVQVNRSSGFQVGSDVSGALVDATWVEFRLEWTMSSVSGGSRQPDGTIALFVNGVQALAGTGLTLADPDPGWAASNPNNYWQLVQFCPLGLGDDLVIGKP